MNTYSNKHDFPITISEINAGNILIPNRYAVIRTDTNEPLGIISDRYQLVPHKLVIDSFRKALVRTDMDFKENISLSRGGAYLNAKYNFPDKKNEVAKGDIVSMQIILENSYDTTTSVKFILGALRLVCTNGLIVAERFTSYSQKHTQQFLIDEMTNEIANFVSDFNNIVIPKMRIMSEVAIPQEMSEKYFSKYEDKKTYPLWLINEAREKYNKEKSTVWEYYNSFTYALWHSSSNLGIKSQIGYSKKAWKEVVRLTTKSN